MAAACLIAIAPLAAEAQPEQPQLCPCPPPPPPPPIWTGSAGLGLGITSGNSDTRNLNISFELQRDAKQRHVFKTAALYLWSSQSDEETANRLGFQARDEYKLSTRAFLFGEGRYVRDPFQGIDSLFAPTAGIGYKLFDSDRFKASVDGGGGVTWEKNPGLETRTYGAVAATEDLAYKLSETASLTHTLKALWKANEWDDALYTFRVGLAASVTSKTTVKVDLLDSFKTRPPTDDIEKNDVALIVALAYKVSR